MLDNNDDNFSLGLFFGIIIGCILYFVIQLSIMLFRNIC